MRAFCGLLFLPLLFGGAALLFGTPPVFVQTREALPILSAYQTFAVSDMNGDGEPDFVAASFQSSPAVSHVSVFFGNAIGTYRQGPVLALAAEFEPRGIAIADFNHDGLADIAVFGVSGLVEMFTQQSSGSFVGENLPFTFVNYYATAIAAADMNNDGLPDLIIPTANGTAVLLNSGAGQFEAPVYVNTVQGSSVTVADLNNDKNLDLITVGGTTKVKLNVQLGVGNGTFRNPASQPQVTGSVEDKLAVADFNLDGHPDIALVTYLGPGSSEVAVLNGNGDGTFGLGYTSPLSLYSYGVTTADTNGDGMPELLLVETDSVYLANLLVFENEGQGTFAAPQVYLTQPDAANVAVVTPGPAGHPEAIVVPSEGSFATVFRSNASGAFSVLTAFEATNPPYGLSQGDFNGDGREDLVGLDESGIHTYLNTGNNKSLFTALPVHPFTPYASLAALATGDFNGDGRLDVAAVYNSTADPELAVAQTFSGIGDGTFASPGAASYAGTTAVLGVTAADMNGDGKLDLVTNFLSVELGNGDGTFAPAKITTGVCVESGSPFIADFNHDGKLDAMIDCGSPGRTYQVELYLGNGDGTFQPKPAYSGSFPYLTGFTVGDFNGDGIPDFVTTNAPYGYLPQLIVYFGAGDGTFSKGPVVELPILVVDFPVSGDFNGDGILDLALVDIYDSVVSVFAGKGDGTFDAPQNFGLEIPPAYMLAGAFHAGAKPGKSDLIVGSDDTGPYNAGSGFEVILNATQ